MAKVEGACRELCEATEFVAIITDGGSGAHLVGNWGDYMRTLGIGDDTITFPVGHYHQTEANLEKNDRIQLLIASRRVRGTYGPGQGCVITGKAKIVTSGEIVDTVKAKFPWARGAMVIRVEDVAMQL